MEIGSHDRLQEGVLSLELANGVNQYPNNDETSMETEQQRAGSMHAKQWLSGHCKTSDTQQQQTCWNIMRGAKPVRHTDMEDAHNLVSFSNIVGSLPPSSSPSCLVQPNTTKLYEKFTQEMGSDEAQAKHSTATPEVSCQPPEDLNTLQTALSQAKHGNKPPNCNCDGPDCPDYLEWLEKKIKLATNEDKGVCKSTDSPQHLQHQLQQPHLQVNGHCLSSSYPQQQRGIPADQVPGSKPPIPCSPQVLSIAKEKNISLQTAIAIEALTQLSGTSSLCQANYNRNLHQHTQNLPSQPPNGSNLIVPSTGNHSSSSRSQSVPPGLHTSQQASVACEHHRPQSQGQPANAAPLPSSTSPFPGHGKRPGFSPSPLQWQQCSGKGSEQKNPWMCMKSEPHPHYATAPHSSSNPMSELKQLLGDTSGKFSNAPFKLPVTQQLRSSQNGNIQAQDNSALVKIKQEPDSGEHYNHTASVRHHGMANCQQQGQHYPGAPLSPGQAAISHSTQAALQQHLHYKRNLFSNHSTGFGAPGPRASMACQNLKKWWPQMETEGSPHLAIKQEPKEPKKKKNSQASPLIKSMSGMLTASPLPKPKQIIIKKTKQKASMPTFLPQTQITVQKQPVLQMDRALALTNLQPGSLPPLSTVSNCIQASAAGLPASAQTQVSISNSPVTPTSILSALSQNNPALTNPSSTPVSTVDHAKSETLGSLTTNNTSIPASLTSMSPSSSSALPGLINIDPKYEELIRQFEAEFGDTDTPGCQPMEENATAPQPRNLSQTSPQDLSSTSPSKSLSAPLIITTQTNSIPHPNNMEVNNDESGTDSEATLNQASTERPMEEQQERPVHDSLDQEAIVDKQQLPSVLGNTFSMPGSPLSKRMKIEASGDVAVLSTTCYSEEDTPTKDSLPSSPSLRGFLESPLRYLESPIKTLLDTPSKDLQAEFPTCTCVGKLLSDHVCAGR